VQAARAESKLEWKARVKAASYDALPDGDWTTDARLAVTIFHFPSAPMRGDIDNIVKLILDALDRHIYNDDAQVERIVVQKFEPERAFPFANPSPVLATALIRRKPIVYIRLSDDPSEDLV
jgi:Holliday junction resolvase